MFSLLYVIAALHCKLITHAVDSQFLPLPGPPQQPFQQPQIFQQPFLQPFAQQYPDQTLTQATLDFLEMNRNPDDPRFWRDRREAEGTLKSAFLKNSAVAAAILAGQLKKLSTLIFSSITRYS